MRKTAQDGDSASEPPEVTTEAHSQSAKDSQSSLDERDAENESQLATGATSEAKPSSGEPDIDIEIEGSEDATAAEVAPAPLDAQAEERAADSAQSPADEPEVVAADDSEAAARANDELDVQEAERYAASFRPSWEPDFPVTPMIPPAQIVGATGGKARVVRHNTRSDLAAPKLRKHRGTSYAILAGSLMGMAALFYIAIKSTNVRPTTELARASVETKVHAARTEEERPAAPQPPPEAASESTVVAAAAPIEQPPLDPALEPLAMAATPAADPVPEAPLAADPVETASTPVPPVPEPVPDLKLAPAQAPVTPQPSAAPPAATITPEPGDRPTKVLLSLAAHPPTTRLRLDGVPIANPFRTRLPRSSTHRIEARAPGFTPEVHSLRLEADAQLMISLKREPIRDVKPDPYRDQRRSAAVQPAPTRNRGAGFVADNPY